MRISKIFLLRAAFGLYILIMLWLLFGQRMGTQMAAGTVNLIPLRTIEGYMRELASPFYRRAVINIFGNILTFVPLGFFLPAIFPKLASCIRCLAMGIVTVIAIECLQLITRLGCMDIDDLLLNILGILLGFGMHRLFLRIENYVRPAHNKQENIL